jgi:hypothetical protein
MILEFDSCPYGKIVNLSTFFYLYSPFSVEGDKCWSQKGGEKFTHFVKKRCPFGRQNDDKKV